MLRLGTARAILALLAIGCVASTSARVDNRSTTFDRLTSADLASVSMSTLYEAIAMLRPGFLLPNLRGEPPTVFVDGTMTSAPNILESMRTSDVAEVRFLSGIDATTRHGSVHSGAIIEVKLRAR